MHFFGVHRARRVLFQKKTDDCGSQTAGALCADRDAIGAVHPHDGRGVGHFDTQKPRCNAGVPRDLAGRLGAVMARRLSNAADGAATGPPDRGRPRRFSISTRPIAGADGGA